ncbi:UvrD-helicase domain-containing protein [Cupriavidus sp. CV2]|uniref:UvrD-helicase domain-containing protein n=1 Tax=Cupriavidus ulmosensis TaxID=3065913 RepID=UPI00296AB835|nr:UvrD-helicase domain-containing protein [Cupriavidus sp. CV2]MDW3680338.1 UvrD-helicase domain-containing protein [Cupriavidus sp. CV2]
MSKRLLSSDTDADRTLRACIEMKPPQSFVVRAGAGSGKTTSLIKALASVLDVHGPSMRKRKQKVACITYTDLAAQEVSADVEADPLVQVSTIHSFYWFIVKSFQADIKSWVIANIHERIERLGEEAARFSNRTRPQTRENNARDVTRYTAQLGLMTKVNAFNYGMGSDYPKGILGHDDIIKIANFLLMQRPLFRQLLALSFPFVFIDESQDTMVEVADSFKCVEAEMRGKFCLGFFGDPMQKIYLTGIGNVLHDGTWKDIDKPENYRCAQTILAVANAVRNPGDGLVQVRGAMKSTNGVLEPIVGTARLFVLPAAIDRQHALGQVREWTARMNDDDGWRGDRAEDVKVLVIVHRMAAKRMGFGDLYAALNDDAPSNLKQGFQDATAWPLKPFIAFVLPLVSAMKSGDEFSAMNLLREFSPLLKTGAQPGKNVAASLRDIRTSVLRLVDLMEPGAATTREVLGHIRDFGLYSFDQRYQRALDLVLDYPEQRVHQGGAGDQAQEPAAATGGEADGIGDSSASSDTAVLAFLKCSASEMWPYRRYVAAESPFATQHGVKGAEFDRVLVVMDEEESEFNLYNYEKYFGITRLTKTDEEKLAAGDDNVVARTRRLLYVCCTRAKRDLVLILFTQDEAGAREKVRQLGILPDDCVLGSDALA